MILAADAVGYSRLVAANEEAALKKLKASRAAINKLVAAHGGRIFGGAGDSIVIEFASAVQAVRAAVAIQRQLHHQNTGLAAERRMDFRIGVNLGDVIVEGSNLLGDGVNVAARLQALAEPAGIFISGTVRDQIDGKVDFPLLHLGDKALRNIPRPIPVYRIDWQSDDPVASKALDVSLSVPDKPSIAVLPFVNMSGDPEQEYFSDGITEDIITDLSRISGLHVIARNSVFTLKGKAVDVQDVGRRFGVGTILEGSVRKAHFWVIERRSGPLCAMSGKRQ